MSSELAPDGLALVQAFVNTVELPDGDDELATPEAAAAWLGEHAVAIGTVEPRHVKRLIETREAIRDVLEAHTGENVEPDVVVRLQGILGQAALVPVLTKSGAALAPSQPRSIDGFLAALSAAIVEASFRGTWQRLKVCRQDSCRWAFYDRSKNGCACWCSMRVCGSREKARAYRARQRSQVAAAAPQETHPSRSRAAPS